MIHHDTPGTSNLLKNQVDYSDVMRRRRILDITVAPHADGTPRSYTLDLQAISMIVLNGHTSELHLNGETLYLPQESAEYIRQHWLATLS